MFSVANHGFVPTKSSMLKQKPQADFKTTTFITHKAKEKKRKIEDITETIDKEINEIDMKKARHEVVKFGMSGFDPQKKEEAKIQLAISLGAKPHKNKYINYKQLQEEKRKNQKNEKQRLEFQQLGKNQLGKSVGTGKFFKRKKDKGGLLDIYGKPTLKEDTKKDVPIKKKR